MTDSKEWDWKEAKSSIWVTPSEECYYIANRWRNKGYKDLLDFGCGLGRHSVFFAKQGFNVRAFDLSKEGVEHLEKWAKDEGVTVDARVADMLDLPYDDGSFDCIFAYHVVSHTDTLGFRKTLMKISRILRPGGEIYLTLCSKSTW